MDGNLCLLTESVTYGKVLFWSKICSKLSELNFARLCVRMCCLFSVIVEMSYEDGTCKLMFLLCYR